MPSLRPAATLASLFILGWPQPLADVEAALPTLAAAGADALGLLEVSGDEVRALVDLRPYAFVDASGEASWWIASDLGELALGGALREDHVLGVGGASATLAGLMIPRTVDSALDLGTGIGIVTLSGSMVVGPGGLAARLTIGTTLNFGAGVILGGAFRLVVNTGTVIPGPPIGVNTTGQEAEGPHCVGAGGGH